MILPFNDSIINYGEINKQSFKNCNFIGFLNQYGQVIDYSNKFGIGGHDSNPATDLFIRWFYIKYKTSIFGEEYLLNREKKECNRCRKELKEKIDMFVADNTSDKRVYGRHYLPNPYYRLKQDIYIFFYDCYQNDSFIEGFGRDYTIMNMDEFEESPYSKLKMFSSFRSFRDCYEYYRVSIIMSFFKDVMVQYLGYHSVERIPKTITTSNIKIYETFYNYLLNDYKVIRIPKMIYDVDMKRYIEYNFNDALLPDSELRLKDEIQAIKKLVPVSEIHKYYR